MPRRISSPPAWRVELVDAAALAKTRFVKLRSVKQELSRVYSQTHFREQARRLSPRTSSNTVSTQSRQNDRQLVSQSLPHPLGVRPPLKLVDDPEPAPSPSVLRVRPATHCLVFAIVIEHLLRSEEHTSELQSQSNLV